MNLVGGGVELEGVVEREGYFGASGQLLLTIMVEPPDRHGASANTQTDDSTHAAANHGSGDDCACGDTKGCGGSGVSVADDGAFVVDMRCFEVVEVDDFGIEFISGAVGKADAVRLEADGRWASDGAATVDLRDATVDEASGGEQNDTVAADVGGESCSEGCAGYGRPGGDGLPEGRFEHGADRKLIGAYGNIGDDTTVDVVGDGHGWVDGAQRGGLGRSRRCGIAALVENRSRS